jgi:hypothetical protein
VRKIREPQFDSNEETEVRLVPLKDIEELILRGRINHALVIVAFHLLKINQI